MPLLVSLLGRRQIEGAEWYPQFLAAAKFHLMSHVRFDQTAPQNNIARSRVSPLFDEPPTVERGVSMDQDGKSNVWAIEPKMEIENKSSEEKTGGALIAVGGFAVFAAIAAAALTNLPDPDQF